MRNRARLLAATIRLIERAVRNWLVKTTEGHQLQRFLIQLRQHYISSLAKGPAMGWQRDRAIGLTSFCLTSNVFNGTEFAVDSVMSVTQWPGVNNAEQRGRIQTNQQQDHRTRASYAKYPDPDVEAINAPIPVSAPTCRCCSSQPAANAGRYRNKSPISPGGDPGELVRLIEEQ